MNEKQEVFNDYINKLKKMNLNSKKFELFESLKEFVSILESLSKTENIELNYLNTKEIEDLYKENSSEDDFVEAILVYVEIIKDLVGQYLIQKESLN